MHVAPNISVILKHRKKLKYTYVLALKIKHAVLRTNNNVKNCAKQHYRGKTKFHTNGYLRINRKI